MAEFVRKYDPHYYESDPQSGAGNCKCGLAERHRKHYHEYTPAMNLKNKCTCGLSESEICHWVNVSKKGG